ncbi:MAG: VTT domain-containing protein [Verrucomicrobia bacterium]|nr:VTT domain-containing protein [Verrucomicrobiota bacterium]
MRLLWLFLGLAAVLLIPFLLWGDRLEVTPELVAERLRGFGPWAWVVAFLLLAADLFLPVPATAVLAALGFLYGPWAGGLLGALGSVSSGLLGYGLCRALGHGVALRLVGERDLERGTRLFERFGAWLVVLSRWLPLFPEVISCAAGLIRMPWTRFVGALVCGSVPMSFTYAWVGHAGNRHPGLATALSLLGPPVLWLLIGRLLTERRR